MKSTRAYLGGTGLLPSAVALIAVLLSSCQLIGPDVPGQDRAIKLRNGTSFGECIGYCQSELSIDADSLKFELTSWESSTYPKRTYSRRTVDGEFSTLLSKFNLAAFAHLDSVYGCPDCADGGAEWLEIEEAGRSGRRVIFEFGNGPEETVELLGALRILREESRSLLGD